MAAVGVIGFKNLSVSAFIGIKEGEKNERQKILIDVAVTPSLSLSKIDDDINNTLDYGEIRAVCLKLAQRKKYNLLETYASEVLEELFRRFNLKEGKIKVKKRGCFSDIEHAFFELRKER